MVWSSKYGKLRERERLIGILGLGGSEKVGDVAADAVFCSMGCPAPS